MRDRAWLFTDRVEAYSRYRPSYPADALRHLRADLGLGRDSVVADVGSGTGIFTELLLDQARTVLAVEPNAAMREVAERHLGRREGFISVEGTAERTSLASSSVDFISAAQAFHWFDVEKAKVEFKRILNEEGRVILVWNRRLVDTPFLAEYEHCLDESIPEYRKEHHSSVSLGLIRRFIDRDFLSKSFPNYQRFELVDVLGRLRSSSYAPAAGSPAATAIEERLKAIFDRYAEDGMIDFRYETEVFSGKLS